MKSKGFLTAHGTSYPGAMGVIIVPTMVSGLLGDDKVSESSTDSGEQADTLGIAGEQIMQHRQLTLWWQIGKHVG